MHLVHSLLSCICHIRQIAWLYINHMQVKHAYYLAVWCATHCPSVVHHPEKTNKAGTPNCFLPQLLYNIRVHFCCCCKSAILIPTLCCKNGPACLWGRGCTTAHTSYPGEEKRKYFTLAWKGWGFLCFFLYLSRKSWQSSHINEQHHQSLHWQWAEKRGICQTDDILLFSGRARLFIALFHWQKAYCIGMGLQRRLCNKSA